MNDISLWVKAALVLDLFLVWSTMSVILVKFPRSRTKSMSQHIAAQASTHRLFSISTSIALMIFYYITAVLVIPKLGISNLFLVIITVGTLAQLIATWVPDTGQSKSTTHRVAAYLAASCYPLLLLGFATSTQLHEIVRVYLVLGPIIELIAISMLALRHRLILSNYLPLQLGYIAIWHIGLLATVLTL